MAGEKGRSWSRGGTVGRDLYDFNVGGAVAEPGIGPHAHDCLDATAAGLASRAEERTGREWRPCAVRELPSRHLLLDARHEVDDVACAEKHEDVAGAGREEEMSPSFVERPRQEYMWGLSPEGGVEVGDVAAEEGFFEGGVDGGEHHLVRRRESGWKFIAQGLRARVAVGLEQDAKAGGAEGTRHVDGTFQLRRMVGVVGVDAHVICTGDLLKAAVGKGRDGVRKGRCNLFAREASRKCHGDGGERVRDVMASEHGNIRPVGGIHLRPRREAERHDFWERPSIPLGTDPLDEIQGLRVVCAHNDGVACLADNCSIAVEIIFF